MGSRVLSPTGLNSLAFQTYHYLVCAQVPPDVFGVQKGCQNRLEVASTFVLSSLKGLQVHAHPQPH